MIQGIYTPNLVPFTEDGRINEPELRRMINWLIEKGISGLADCGFPQATHAGLPRGFAFNHGFWAVTSALASGWGS